MMHRWTLAALMLACIVGCAQESEPLDPTRRALQLVRSGKYDDAIMTATEAIRAEPDNAEAYLYRGRAYHYRNAMGDRQRAAEDFSDAIRLAPESSDPYYFRAQVYRELGKLDLAASDETRARELDGSLKDTYNRMPDFAPPLPDADVAADPSGEEPKTAEGGGSMPRTEGGQRQLYEELKNRFEPGFGELRPSASRTPGDGSTGVTSREERLRQLTGQGDRRMESEGASDPATSPYDPFAARKPAAATPDAATTTPGTTDPTAPSGTGAATEAPTLRRNVQTPTVPPLTSPFAKRPSTPPATDPAATNPNVQSPFPQRAPGATGFGVPTNPFGTQTQSGTQQGTRRSVSRPFSTPAPTNQNPAVRPLVPRTFP